MSEPFLTENTYSRDGTVSFRTEWYCMPPPMRQPHFVTDDRWRQDEADDIPVREIRSWRQS